ncbi:MAG: alpha/beta fold hydrolase [Bradymonadaceae bacterium]|nr:alpha/beta fold hydrolase [Lujinxingiaceae bacterium]
MPQPYRYAYLHGFASSPLSIKARRLAEIFAAHGHILHLPDLNQPSFAKLTVSGALEALERLDAQIEGGPWRLVGSSMGGYLAARFAELHPQRVDRLVLLCPGFDLLQRWPTLFGKRRMDQWKADGKLALPDAAGELVELWWEFIEDWGRHPAFPQVAVNTLILHGRNDETVPISGSRAYAAERAHVQLVELDDDHRLLNSLDVIGQDTLKFFSID